VTITAENNQRIRLRPPREGDEQAVRAAQIALKEDDFGFAFGLTPDTPWMSYLEWLAREQAGISLAPDRVPGTFLLAEVAGQLVGRASIRHELNDWLLAHAGHIGYGVLPQFRRRGFATQILQQSLIIARAFGVDRVLVTCDDHNVDSAAVIERCGGRRDEQWPTTPGTVPKRRYWID
jgi:predicted acetyltransferase